VNAFALPSLVCERQPLRSDELLFLLFACNNESRRWTGILFKTMTAKLLHALNLAHSNLIGRA
jgi:hypothetical protein